MPLTAASNLLFQNFQNQNNLKFVPMKKKPVITIDGFSSTEKVLFLKNSQKLDLIHIDTGALYPWNYFLCLEKLPK